MKAKTAYIWGPVSTFTAPLAAWLVAKGWHVHIATKSALNLLAFSSLDISSSAKRSLEEVFGTRNKFKAFQERLKFIETSDPPRDTNYDALIFSGLPPNFDDPRVPRAPWAAAELSSIAKHFKGVPLFIISSLWGAVQPDGVVPEELEFERRKTRNHWEKICQRYELKLIEELPKVESSWYLIRLPLITGARANGYSYAFTGLANLFSALDPEFSIIKNSNKTNKVSTNESVGLAHQPDSTLWFLPVDLAVYMFWRYLEDNMRSRICNFVSAQATLNREWLQYLAQALSLKEIIPTTKDNLQLPPALKKLLLDNVQVKTRNLFEVAGRYQLQPEKLTEEYFSKIIQIGRQKNWGQSRTKSVSAQSMPSDLVAYYFEEFIPAKLNNDLLNKVIQGNTSVGFKFKDIPELGWILKGPKKDNGKVFEDRVYVERYLETSIKPSVCFHLTGNTMTSIMRNQLPLHQALLFKQIEIEGPLVDSLRVSKFLSSFMKENPCEKF